LDDLEARVKAAQARHTKPEADGGETGSLLGMAWRLSTELVVAVVIGFGLGYGLDVLFGTKPWIMVLGIIFGFATGIRNTFRVAGEMDRISGHNIPPATDIVVDDDDDD